MDATVAKSPMATGALPYGLAVLAVAIATIAGAFAFQAFGYPPCELCLKERLPYYVGMAIAAIAVTLAWRGPVRATQASLLVLALVFVFSFGFGAYHAGVEWGFWKGPSDCTGALDRAANNQDFLRQLNSFKAVRCDAVAIRILGLSLAGWNAIISLALAATAIAGVARAPSEASR